MINEKEKYMRGDSLTRRLIALALSLLMCFQLLPVTVLAETPTSSLTLPEAKTVMEEIWQSFATNYDKLTAQLQNWNFYGNYADLEKVEEKVPTLTTSYVEAAETYYTLLAAAAKASEGLSEAEIATDTVTYASAAAEFEAQLKLLEEKAAACKLNDYKYDQIYWEDYNGVIRDYWGYYPDEKKVYDAATAAAGELTALTNTLTRMQLSMSGVSRAETILAEIDKLTAAYLSNMATATTFVENYLTELQNSASPSDIYNVASTTDRHAYDRQDSFTWTDNNGAGHTDTKDRYDNIDATFDLTAERTKIYAALKENETLYGQLQEAWTKLGAALSDADAVVVQELKAEIDSLISEYKSKWNSDKYDICTYYDKYDIYTYYPFNSAVCYTKRLPYYNFSDAGMFTDRSDDAEPYTHSSSGLELAFILDNEHGNKTFPVVVNSVVYYRGKTIYLSRQLYELAMGKSDTDHVAEDGAAYLTQQRAGELVVSIAAEAEVYQYEENLRRKRVALDELYYYDDKPIEDCDAFFDATLSYDFKKSIKAGGAIETAVNEWKDAIYQYVQACSGLFDMRAYGRPQYLAAKMAQLEEMYLTELGALRAQKAAAKQYSTQKYYSDYVRLTDYRINALNSILATFGKILPMMEGKLASKTDCSPYTEEKLARISDTALGLDAARGVTRTVAMRNYLRLQKLELQVWLDVANQTVEEDRTILNGTNAEWNDIRSMSSSMRRQELTAYNRYDLRWSMVENAALAVQLQQWLDDVEDLYEEYNEKAEVGSTSGSAGDNEIPTYEEAKAAYESAAAAYEQAAAAAAAAEATYEAAKISSATDAEIAASAARLERDQAQKAEKDKKAAMETARELMYTAAMKSGDEWLAAHGAQATTWRNAYRQSLVDAAKAKYDAKNGELTVAKSSRSTADSAAQSAKSAMDTAKSEADTAMATYTELVTQLVAAKSAMNGYAKYPGTTSTEYIDAVAAYEALDGQVTAQTGVLTEKTKIYNGKAAAYSDALEKSDAWKATVTSLQEETNVLLNVWNELKAQQASATDVFEEVPTVNPEDAADMTAYSLELNIMETEDAISRCEKAVEESYLAFSTLESLPDDAAKGEIIYQFLKNKAELEGQRISKVSLEAALALKYHPLTLESATYNAKLAAQDYYYAKRDYEEFHMLEGVYMGEFSWVQSRVFDRDFFTFYNDDEPDNRDSYGYVYEGTINYVGSPEAVAMTLAGETLRAGYSAKKEQLKQAMDEAEAYMNEQLRILEEQELAYEKTLKTAAAIESRYNALQGDYNDLRTNKWEPNNTLCSSLYSAAENDRLMFDNLFYSQVKSETFNAARYYQDYETAHSAYGSYELDTTKYGDFATVFHALEDPTAVWRTVGSYDTPADDQLTRLVQWMNFYGGDNYRNLFAEFKVAEALVTDKTNGRDKMLARINRMGDQYALQVDTQSTNGNGVLFLTVVYTDTDGFERKEYIFPFIDGYKRTMEEAGASLAETMKAQTGEAVDPTQCAVNQDHIDTMARLGQAGSISQVTPLSAWSSDAFLFRTQYEMAKKDGSEVGNDFKHFEVFTERQKFKDAEGNVNSNIKNSWSLSGMRLFHVDDFYGMSVYGYGGSSHTQSQLEFKGQQIGNLVNNLAAGGVISWVTDDLQELGTDAKFGIDSTMIDFATGKVGPDSGAGLLDRVPDEDSEYLFKLDFADFYGAGVEGLVNFVTDTRAVDTAPTSGTTGTATGTSVEATGTSISKENVKDGIDPSAKTSIKDLGLAECLTFNVVYKDNVGTRRQVEVPVITSSLAWAVDHGVDENDKIFGYAQQDDSIVFSAYLPEMSELSISDCTLVFDYVIWEQSDKCSALARSNFKDRRAQIIIDKEVLLAGMQVYAPGTYSASATVEQGVIVPTVTGDPMYYQTAADNSRGLNYGYGGRISPSLSEYEAGAQLAPKKNTSNMYMLVIQTDTPLLAATEASPSIELNYTTKSGRSMISAAANVAENGRDFYGYWPGINFKDLTVTQATGSGGQLKLLYQIEDLKQFDSVRITMPENTTDDWQISGLYIMQLTEIGSRFAVWENITAGKELLTDRRYERTVSGNMLTEPLEKKVLLQAGDETLVSFENGVGTVPEATETDWNEVRYYMDAETAQGNLGFTKARETYTIKVQVNDEGASTVSDGDCGSVNNFYFQLVFANGRSAYVLANQQLSGDGFRTGYIETFTINTNRDYGELQAVRIIPDDNSADSDIFDKLNIKRIKVSRNSDESVSRTWVITDIGDNGWISFDYHDDAETYGVLGRPGRSEADICVNCPVGYVTYSTKLLFALGTGQSSNNDVENTLRELTEGITDEEQIEKIREVLSADIQYQGQLSMTLLYRNNKGNVETMTVDVVGAMAAYANKVADREERMDDSGNVITGTQYLSNKEYMFRPGHTDRFEVDVSDITELVSIDLIPTGASSQSAFWTVTGLDVFLLKDSGILNINVNNEYEKTNTLTAERLCGIMNVPFTYWCPAANPEKMSFTFGTNKLDVDTTAATWDVAPSRVPDSHNDTANIYVYTSGSTFRESDNQYNRVYTQIQYTTSYGQVYNGPLREMSEGMVDSNKMFYTSGVDIANISVLNKLKVQLNSKQNQIVVDHIVIQQIRNDVVIATYVMQPGEGENIVGNVSAPERYFYPSGDSISGTVSAKGDKQVVTIGFGAGTETARLVNENRDIGVAIRYTSTNDVEGSTREYNSPYIYLTDQDIIAIGEGGTAQLTFHEQYVKQITGIVLIATGGLKVSVDSASVELWKEAIRGNTETYEHTDDYWYSVVLDKPVTLEVGSQTIKTYLPKQAGEQQKVASPYTIELTSGAETPSGAIRMSVKYKKTGNDIPQTVVFNDIRNNLVTGGIMPNQSAMIRVMLGDNVEKVLEVSFEPVASGARWIISELKTRLERTGEGIFAKNGLTAENGAPAVFDVETFNDINLTVTASTPGSPLQSSNQSGGMKFNDVAPGQEVTITATITGSDEKADIKVERMSAASWTDVTASALTTEVVGEKWVFASNYSEDTVYKITLKASMHSENCEPVEIVINYKAGTALQSEEPPVLASKAPSAQESAAPVTQTGSGQSTGGVVLNHAKLTLTAGAGQYQLTETSGKTVTWSTSDASLATVEGGLVKAGPNSRAGVFATITATDAAGNSATCQVGFNDPA